MAALDEILNYCKHIVQDLQGAYIIYVKDFNKSLFVKKNNIFRVYLFRHDTMKFGCAVMTRRKQKHEKKTFSFEMCEGSLKCARYHCIMT